MPYQTSEVAGWWVLPQASTTVYLMFYMLKNKSKIIKEFNMNTRKSIVDSFVGFYWNHGKSWKITLPHTQGADMEALHALGSRFPVLPPDTDPWRIMTNGWVVFFNLEASAHKWKPCLGKSYSLLNSSAILAVKVPQTALWLCVRHGGLFGNMSSCTATSWMKIYHCMYKYIYVIYIGLYMLYIYMNICVYGVIT